MIEEVMCMSNRMHQLMKQKIVDEDGETLLHPPGIFYAYKRARAADARNNWLIYNERHSVGYSDSTTDGFEPMDQEDEMNVHAPPPPLNSPLSQPLPASVDDNSSTYSSADDALSQGMENGLSNVPSDLVNSSNVDDGLPVQDGTNCNHILLSPQEGTRFRETYDKIFTLGLTIDAINTQKNAGDAYLRGGGLVMQKYDTQLEQEYCNMYGNEDGKKLFTVNQATRHNVMKNNWKDEMIKSVPRIAEDPELHRSILTANPKYVAGTLRTLVEDWDGLWEAMKKEDMFLYDMIRDKFTKDEYDLVNRQMQAGSSMHAGMSTNPAMRDPTIPCDKGAEAAQQSNTKNPLP